MDVDRKEIENSYQDIIRKDGVNPFTLDELIQHLIDVKKKYGGNLLVEVDKWDLDGHDVFGGVVNGQVMGLHIEENYGWKTIVFDHTQ
jgi:hypothetical protein